MYARTDLGDFYRGSLTLRQVLVRILALPLDSPLQQLLAAQAEEVEQRRNAADIDKALSVFDKPRG